MIRWVAVALVLLVCGPALADEPPAPPVANDAQALLAEASRLYTEDADYAGALEKFRKAHELVPSWRALNGVALCQRALGDNVGAHATYSALLDQFGSQLTDEQRALANEHRADVRKLLALVKISAAQVGAAVSFDGVDLGVAPLTHERLVEPGRHIVTAKLDGHVPFIDRIDASAASEHTVKVELEPEKERVVVKLKNRKLARPMPAWVPWATMGAGAAVAAVGTLVVLSGRSDLQSFDDQVADMAGDVPRSVVVDEGLLDSGRSKRTIGASLWIAGGVIAAGGVVLAIINQPRPVREHASAGITPRAAWVAFRF